MSQTNRNEVAEQKFRPLKKQLQQTVKRLSQSVRADGLPARQDVEEFVSQVAIMVSYPGFGDDAYPEILAASQALAERAARGDLAGLKEALATVQALKKRCHAGRTPAE